MNKMIVAIVAAASMTIAACGPQMPYDQGQVGDQVVQQGGSFVQDHPIATAAAVGAGAYWLGKRNERRNGYGYGYRQPRRVIVHRTVVRPSAYRSNGYRTVTRTVRYRR